MSDPKTLVMKTKRWLIGDVRVTRVVEGCDSVDAGFFLGGATRDLVKSQAWLMPHFSTKDGQVIAVRQTFVIESQGHRILVDTGVGNDKTRTIPLFNKLQTPFLSDLKTAGFPIESVDTVLCTHLHVDHVGWNTRLVDGRWLPTFPKARYLFGREEWDYWNSQSASNPDGDVMGDSVRPVVEAGLVDSFEVDHALTAEVRLIPTPGHTPGHVSVVISSQGRQAIIAGDVMHHPIQCGASDLVVAFDVDTPTARATRRNFLTTYADAPVAVFGMHFVHPTAGWLRTHGDFWTFDVGPVIEDDADPGTSSRRKRLDAPKTDSIRCMIRSTGKPAGDSSNQEDRWPT